MPHNGKSQATSSEDGHSESEHQGEEKKDKKREYSEAELQRLRESLRKEADKIHKPERKLYMPYTFNSLDPYFDLSTAQFVHEASSDVRHGYASRPLATGLCEPQVALRMDVEIPSKPQSVTPRGGQQQQRQKQKAKDDKERPTPEGSTRLPPFPAIHFSISSVPKKKNYDVNDVPTLRHAVNEQCSPRGHRRVEEDYKRTKADFYRMELDKMDEYGPANRSNMKAAYFAYLQNTVGSRKALRECIRSIKDDEEEDDRKTQDQGDKKEQRSKDKTGDRQGSASSHKSEKDEKEDREQKERKEQTEGGDEGRRDGKEKQLKRDGEEHNTRTGKKRDSSTTNAKQSGSKSLSANNSDSEGRAGDSESTPQSRKKDTKTEKNKQASGAKQNNF